jgi:hypothetical protein
MWKLRGGLLGLVQTLADVRDVVAKRRRGSESLFTGVKVTGLRAQSRSAPETGVRGRVDGALAGLPGLLPGAQVAESRKPLRLCAFVTRG